MEYSRIPKKPSIKLQLGFWFLMFILIFVSGIFFIFIAIELFSSGYVVMLMVLASIGFDIIIISFLGKKFGLEMDWKN